MNNYRNRRGFLRNCEDAQAVEERDGARTRCGVTGPVQQREERRGLSIWGPRRSKKTDDHRVGPRKASAGKGRGRPRPAKESV